MNVSGEVLALLPLFIFLVAEWVWVKKEHCKWGARNMSEKIGVHKKRVSNPHRPRRRRPRINDGNLWVFRILLSVLAKLFENTLSVFPPTDFAESLSIARKTDFFIFRARLSTIFMQKGQLSLLQMRKVLYPLDCLQHLTTWWMHTHTNDWQMTYQYTIHSIMH